MKLRISKSMHVFISKDYKITISNMGLVRVTIIRAVMML